MDTDSVVSLLTREAIVFCIKELVYFRLDGLFEAVSYICEPLLMKFEIEKGCKQI